MLFKYRPWVYPGSYLFTVNGLQFNRLTVEVSHEVTKLRRIGFITIAIK